MLPCLVRSLQRWQVEPISTLTLLQAVQLEALQASQLAEQAVQAAAFSLNPALQTEQLLDELQVTHPAEQA
jgi:hypothetical protein